jgi:uncharacterized protein
MSFDPLMSLAGLAIGFVIGLTGMGGGALLTPALVLLFQVPVLTAVSSDLVLSLLVKPVGAAVHHRKRTIRTDILVWLVAGSVPSAFAGSLVVHYIRSDATQTWLKTVLGCALVLAAIGMVARNRFLRGRSEERDATIPVRPMPTLVVGIIGGLVVGLTSVGSGSLMIVALMWLYPRLTAAELIGTDLTQAIPLVASAAFGHLLFGDVEFAIVGSLLVGALPGVWAGSRVSAHGNDTILRPVLITLLSATGLKLVGLY